MLQAFAQFGTSDLDASTVRQIERLAGPLVIVVGIAAVILIVIGAVFVSRHEAQLVAEAERALPGPLKWP